MTALVLRADLVAPVANMLAAAWAAGGNGAPAQTSVHEAPGKPPAPQAREVSQDEGRDQDSYGAPRPDGGDLCAPVDVGPGPRPHRVDRAPVRAGWRGVAAGLACGWHRGDRHRSGGLRALNRGPRRVQSVGCAGVSGRSPVSYTHLTLPTILRV